MTQDKPGRSHYPVLDGLRGVATIFVVLYHYFGFIAFFHFGWIGIELFFVLSGFLISARLIPYLNQKYLLPKFYWNRFLRIVPLYFTFLLIFFLCWFFLTSSDTQREYPFYHKHYWQFFLFVQNWVYIFDFSQTANHLQHLWSLAVEEQIYLVYPFLLIVFYKKNKFLLLSLLAIFIIAIVRTVYYQINVDALDYQKIYWNTFFRFDSFLCGVCIYLLYTNFKNKYTNWVHYLGLFSISILIAGILITGKIDKDNPFFTTFGRTFLALSFSYIMWLSLSKKNNWLKKILTQKFLIFTGKISYGIYIFHWPFLLTGFAILNKLNKIFHLNKDFETIHFVNILFSIILTYSISYLSYRFYESRFLRWKKKMSS